MNSLSNEILELIIHTRKSVEELAIVYHDGGMWGDGLAGYCGIASRFLISLFRRNGIHNARLICGTFGTVESDGAFRPSQLTHCWVEYGDFCIDVTISQFAGFEKKKYRICKKDSEFYYTHYFPELVGSTAVKYQKQWDEQSYESCSSILWRIHKVNYVKEYNGLVLR